MENVKRVLQILSSQPNHQLIEATAHDAVLSILAGNADVAATQALVTLYAEDPAKHDEYWTPVFEAHIAGQYSSAQQITDTLREDLLQRRFKCNRAHVPVIVGMLKAANWCEGNGLENPIFTEHLPQTLALLLMSYTDGSYSEGGEKPGMWITGQFSEAFSKFFNHLFANERWRRIEVFASRIVGIDHIGKQSEAIMEEVTSRMLRLMSRPMAMKSVASSLVTAAKQQRLRSGRA